MRDQHRPAGTIRDLQGPSRTIIRSVARAAKYLVEKLLVSPILISLVTHDASKHDCMEQRPPLEDITINGSYNPQFRNVHVTELAFVQMPYSETPAKNSKYVSYESKACPIYT